MEFCLSEEQKLLQESVGGYLASVSSIEKIRETATGPEPMSKEIFDGLTELGVNSVLIPEEHGGMAMTLLDAALIQEMIGRHAAPVPYFANAGMAVVGLNEAGTKEQKELLFPKIATGEARVGIAMSERTGARENARVIAEDGKLNGRSLFVLDTGSATDFIVCDKDGGLHLVKADAAGLEVKDMDTIDNTRSVGELKFSAVDADPLTNENGKGLAASRMLAAGRVLAAADTVGASQMMLEKAVAYSLERKQFNRIIGSYQAVKHMCAEMAAKLDPCHSLLWYAAYAADAIPEEAELASLHAKSHISEVGTFCARVSTEVHGGIGFTEVLGLHFWFKRIGFNRQVLGGPTSIRAEAAKLQFG
jgi:alkylation response protein AidB-like acyl-CoA dehydrogenase